MPAETVPKRLLSTELAPSEPAPAEVAAADSAPISAPSAPEAPSVASSPPIEPRAAGLLLIETNEPSAYLYWELAIPAPASNGVGAEPHWVCVVLHAPRGAGSERRELRFPVFHASGAVRLEGLPAQAVVRAKLSHGDSPAPLVVAGSVWAADSQTLAHAEPRFVPYGSAPPAELAARAAQHLAEAAPIYC